MTPKPPPINAWLRLEPGDVVYQYPLAGPRPVYMTVERASAREVACVWFDARSEIHHGRFKRANLRLCSLWDFDFNGSTRVSVEKIIDTSWSMEHLREVVRDTFPHEVPCTSYGLREILQRIEINHPYIGAYENGRAAGRFARERSLSFFFQDISDAVMFRLSLND